MAIEVDHFPDLSDSGSSRDEVLTAMKERGLTITQAIKATMALFGVGLGDAKSIVTSHPSWSETARAARPFQDALIEAFRIPGTPGE